MPDKTLDTMFLEDEEAARLATDELRVVHDFSPAVLALLERIATALGGDASVTAAPRPAEKTAPPKPLRANTRWRRDEVDALRRLIAETDLSYPEIAARLDRKPGGIAEKVRAMELLDEVTYRARWMPAAKEGGDANR